jgi:two-component system chemotaxis sensor kinase CheA
MQDPLKYFRVEAREILEQLQRGLLELERAEQTTANIPRLLRLGHTLKGAARVVKQLDIAKLAHELEDLLVPLREQAREAKPDEIERLLGLVDTIAREIGRLAPAPTAAPAPVDSATRESSAPRAPAAEQQQPAPQFEETVRVAVAHLEDVDVLMDGVAELSFQLGSARRSLPGIERSRNLAEQLAERLDPRRNQEWGPGTAAALRGLAGELESRLTKLEREMATSLEQATRELGQVRDRVDQLRLVSAASMFGTLERTARDAAVSLGKQAVFEAKGGEVRLDADVLTAVQRALVQGVRNAVAHGIETSAERAARGKPAHGRVSLEVLRRGKQICFVCHDDGRGVNVREVRLEAERLGRLPKAASAAPTTDELLSLLLRGGISTSSAVTQVAGRGVGLDLVREALESVGGTVSLRTQPGRGTSLELNVPASLSALDALIVDAGGRQCAIPLDAVVQAARFGGTELSRTASSASLIFEGQVVPFVPLSALLRASAQADHERVSWSALLIRGSGGLLALGVDRLLGAESIVARALPDAVDVDPTVAGVTLDADGNPRLVLDPDSLWAAAQKLPLEPARGTPVRRAILVVDDSLTTRMLEQSILESAGYEVELATSAEQGLEKAQARHYDLFLVDVEMPGMDGFTFVERVRADARLSSTPAVLVTSRASVQDVARGRAAGASAHIDKGEFDQLDFLDKIARLIR